MIINDDYNNKYMKYKSKYIALKNLLEGGTVKQDQDINIIKKIKNPLKQIINLLISISVEQKCCLMDLANLKSTNEYQKEFIDTIKKYFNLFKIRIDYIFTTKMLEKEKIQTQNKIQNQKIKHIVSIDINSRYAFLLEQNDLSTMEQLRKFILEDILPISKKIFDEYLLLMENIRLTVKSNDIPFYNIKERPRSLYYPKLQPLNVNINNCVECKKENNNYKCTNLKSIIKKSQNDKNDFNKCCNMTLGANSCIKQFSINFLVPLNIYFKEIHNTLINEINNKKIQDEILENLSNNVNEMVIHSNKILEKIIDVNEIIQDYNIPYFAKKKSVPSYGPIDIASIH